MLSGDTAASDPAGERGSALLLAVTVIAVVVGFAVAAVRLTTHDLMNVDRLVDRTRGELTAEIGVNEAIGRIVDGATASFDGAGNVNGEPYSYTATSDGNGTWTIDSNGGTSPADHTLDVTLVESAPTGEDRYAIWAEELIDIGYITSATYPGSIGSRERIKFWYTDHTLAASHDVITGGTCENCANPVVISSYDLLPLPPSSGASACPADNSYRIRNVTLAAGTYLCNANNRTLRITDTVDVNGPVVIHVGSDTRIRIEDATINNGGDSADFVIVQENPTSWADEAVIDDSLMFGRILTHDTWWWIGDVTWRGTFEVGTWWLYQWASIDGAWDGGGGGGGSSTWAITEWAQG